MTDSIKSFACIHSGDKNCATTLCEIFNYCLVHIKDGILTPNALLEAKLQWMAI